MLGTVGNQRKTPRDSAASLDGSEENDPYSHDEDLEDDTGGEGEENHNELSEREKELIQQAKERADLLMVDPLSSPIRPKSLTKEICRT